MITFEKKVNNFSAWLVQNYSMLMETIEEGQEGKALTRFNEALSDHVTLLPFQLVTQASGVTFFLEALLDNTVKIVGLYLCERLNQLNLNQCQFLYYRPALLGSFQLGNQQISASDCLLTYTVSKAKHSLDIKVFEVEWLLHLSSEEQYMVLYLMLVDTLGELMCEAYLGKIEMSKGSLRQQCNALKMSELKDHLEKIIVENQWQDPHQAGLIIEAYQSKANGSEFRMDMVEGRCYSLELLNEETTSIKEQSLFLKQCGIGYYTLVWTHLAGQSRQEIQNHRQKIEVKLSHCIQRDNQGLVINTARGKLHSYVDYLVYDPQLIETIENEFKEEKMIEIVEL